MEPKLTEEEKILHKLFKEDQIEKTFEKDPLFQKILSMNAEEKLIQHFGDQAIHDLDFSKGYSTKQAAIFVGKEKQEHQLTNLLAREDLNAYFQVSRIGTANRCRYDWKAIFRFMLYFFLTKEFKLKPLDIAKIIQESGFLKKGEINVEEIPDPIQEDINQLKVDFQLLLDETEQLKKILAENQKSTLVILKRKEEEKAEKDRRFLKNFLAFWDGEYQSQIAFLQKIEAYLEKEDSRQKKEKGFFGWREIGRATCREKV